MLYVCAVPLDADAEGSNGTAVYVLDVLPQYGDRAQIGTEWWKKYRAVFEYARIWICQPNEMPYRKVVDVKFHKGENV